MPKQIEVNDLIGLPFVRYARGPESYDCHGVVIEIFKRFGIDFPDINIAGMAVEDVTSLLEKEVYRHTQVLKDWKETNKPEIPCLIILTGKFQFQNHLGVVLGRDRFIHATESKHGGSISINRMSDPRWRNRIAGYYKYIK